MRCGNPGLESIYWNPRSEGLVSGSGGGNDGVKSLEEGGAVGLAFLALNSPSLIPGQVLAGLQHVVAMPSGDGDEGDSHGVVADLLDGSERHPSGSLRITYY